VPRKCDRCHELAAEAEIEYERLLRIIRLVARHPAYRERAQSFQSRVPDDLWYDPDLGWAVSYRLTGERTLGFAIAGPAEVTSESFVRRAYECREL
jgi:hypothetical protein